MKPFSASSCAKDRERNAPEATLPVQSTAQPQENNAYGTLVTLL
jgi:hypothetical protein